MVRFTGHPGGVGFFRGKGGSFLYEFGFGGGFAIEDFEEGGYGLGAAVFGELTERGPERVDVACRREVPHIA